MEGRLLAGITELFDELVAEEQRRRAGWEERCERASREFQASVESDVARGACESRQALADCRRDAQEARKMATPCHDLLAALARGESPPGLTRLVQQEVRSALASESERLRSQLSQTLSQQLGMQLSSQLGAQLNAQLSASVREQGETYVRMLNEKSGAWAEACAGQMADAVLCEQKAREACRVALESRLAETEARAVLYKDELQAAAERRSAEMEARMGARLHELQEGNASLQVVLERYSDRWEQAWRSEVELRTSGDREAAQRFEVLVESCEARAKVARSMDEQAEQRAEGVKRYVDAKCFELRTESEAEWNARQGADSALLVRMHEVQAEVKKEVSLRTTADQQLGISLKQLRDLVQKVVILVELQAQTGSKGPLDKLSLGALTEAAAEMLVQTVSGSGASPLQGARCVEDLDLLSSSVTLPPPVH